MKTERQTTAPESGARAVSILPAIRVGRQIRIDEQQLREWIERAGGRTGNNKSETPRD
jgi:hypothetical protein